MRTYRSLQLLPVLALLVVGACGDDDPVNEQPDATPQPTTGALSGTVTDGESAALAGAVVTTTPATGTATTDATGGYTLEVEAGTYTVSVAKDGFVAGERAGVVVAAGATVTLDFVLDPLPPATGGVDLAVSDHCTASGLEGVDVEEGGASVGTTDAAGALALEDLAPGEYTFELSAPGYLPVSVTVTVAAGETASASAEMICQTKAVGDLARAFTATIDASFNGVTTAQSLFDRQHDADATNDPVVISVRSNEHYQLGHVPGALNIPWKTVADDPVGLLGAPNDAAKTFVDYCYTGHTGAIAAGILNLLGYRTQNMKFGIVSWTTDATVRTALGVEPDLTKDFPVETTVNTAPSTNELPWLAFDGVTTAWEAAQAAAKAYLSNPDIAPTISAQQLFDLLYDSDPANDPFIVSVRTPEHYALGHIKGAINIPYAQIAAEDNLKKLPTDRDIVVYCYTGHTGGVATGVLGTLGYHRVKNLKFGLMGWTQDATVRAQAPFNAANDAHDFAVTAGPNP